MFQYVYNLWVMSVWGSPRDLLLLLVDLDLDDLRSLLMAFVLENVLNYIAFPECAKFKLSVRLHVWHVNNLAISYLF